MAPAVLEDEHERAVGGRDRQQVEDDRLDCDDDRAERLQQQGEREQEDEREDDRGGRLHLVVEVLRLRRLPGDADLGAVEPADGRGDHRSAERVERSVRLRVLPVALDRERDERDRAAPVVVDVGRLVELAGRNRPVLELGDRGLDVGAVHVVGLDHDRRTDLIARERLLDLVEGLHRLEVLRQGVVPGLARVHVQRRRGEGEQEPGREDGREQRAAQDAIDDRAPHASLAVRAAEPADEREPNLVDLVAEGGEHGRKDGQRPEHGDGDHEDRRDAEPAERLVARQKHPGHGDHDGEARDEDCAARRRSGGLERRFLAAAGGTLLTFPLQVEHRVVDADGEADQQDDHADVLVERDELAGDREQAHRREHRGEREEEREARGDQRAERDQQDAERDGDREDAGLCEVVLDGLVELFGRVDAELLDRHGRVLLDERRDLLLHRNVQLLGALVVRRAKLDADERRVAVGRDLARVPGLVRRVNAPDRLHVREGRRGVADRGLERRIVDGVLRALDQDRVAELLLVLVGDDRVDAAGLARAGLVGVELLRAEDVPDHERGGDEGQPPEDGGLLVRCAPAAHPGCNVARICER